MERGIQLDLNDFERVPGKIRTYRFFSISFYYPNNNSTRKKFALLLYSYKMFYKNGNNNLRPNTHVLDFNIVRSKKAMLLCCVL